MKNQFADYETSKMLNELGFDEDCFDYYAHKSSQLPKLNGIQSYTGYFEDGHYRVKDSSHRMSDVGYGIPAPTRQQIKEWLWQKRKVRILIDDGMVGFFGKAIFSDGQALVTGDYGSPITAENEIIIKTVNHLHLQNKK